MHESLKFSCVIGSCLEIAETPDGGKALRQSSEPEKVIVLSAEEWREVKRRIQTGELA
ncbi:MAG: hypothetical protein WCV85_06600 [Patescibacteria group bacterium]